MKWSWICAAACLASASVPAVAVDEVPSPVAAAESLDVEALVRKAEAIIQVVLGHHLDPPTRQEMWLAGTKALFENVPGASPSGLSRRISQVTRAEDFRAFLGQAWFQELTPEQRRTALPAPRLTAAFLEGLVRAVPQADVLTGSEGVAREQSAGNRYVGTGIALHKEPEGYPAIGSVIRGGPMERAGGRNGDLVTRIGERDTRNLLIDQVIELLRGDEGTTVTLQLRASVETSEPRTVIVTRGPVIFDAVEGLTRDREGKWDFRIEPHLPIGYVRIRQVNGSAVHELRRLEGQFRAEGVAAVILDFRSTSSSDVHHAVLLADALLDGGTIGRLRSSNGQIREFQADRDCLFRGWPLAILIDRTTSGGGEWIAAALQDNRAGLVVGESSAGNESCHTIVHVPGENLSLQLPTGTFERPHRKPMPKRELRALVQADAGPAGPLPGAVIPDRIVPAVSVPPGPGLSAEDVQRIMRTQREAMRARREEASQGKDLVIVTAVHELRNRLD
jgi:carboxyl-terminal processing protease